jgi:2-polyprenyl-3-methyl-5-hydroxy-6-metoxy-1,4-benzoquinol methylase
MHQRDLLLEMDARLDELERGGGARHAEILHRARSERAQLQGLHARMEEADRLVAQSRARPAAEFLPFERFNTPSAGQVYGYRTLETDTESKNGYREFEEMFRGSEAVIRERQRCYLELIAGHEPVLDVGSGRGEFLDLLREQGIRYAGLDLDGAMVERCREKGHENVVVSGANEYLEQLPDESQGAIFSAQVIEHMQYDNLQRFLQLAARKLKRDGLLIAETVNPHSVQAMKAFWLDLTHEQPIFPEVALALCRAMGFGSAYVFHPNGSGSAELDRFVEGDYALVATAPRARNVVAATNLEAGAAEDDYTDDDAPANASPRLAVRRSQHSG